MRIPFRMTVLSALVLWPLLVPAQSFDVTQREPAAIRDRCTSLAEQRDAGTLPLSREVITAPSGLGAMVTGQLRPRVRARKPVEDRFDPLAHTGRIVLKLADDEGFRIDAYGALTAKKPERATSVTSVVTQALGRTEVKRVFARPEMNLAHDRFCGERWTGEEMPDLTQFLLLTSREARTAGELEGLVRGLNAMSFVEIAYLERRSVPLMATLSGMRNKTETYEHLQGYLNAAPQGIDARYAWNIPGGTGQYSKVFDVEIGWDITTGTRAGHEDLPTPFIVLGTPSFIPLYANHGAAVLGILAGKLNGVGVIGIVRDAAIGVSATDESGAGATIANAINLASAEASHGDILSVELQVAGPASLPSGGSCNQPGLITPKAVPVEYDEVVLSAIRSATANQRIVVEAAGNGAQSLVDPAFGGRFDPSLPYFQESGAIIVGARDSVSRVASCMTSYGTRVDASAWGDAVATAGYGDLTPNLLADDPKRYTDSFGGTSSATAIVAGAVALVQSVQKARGGKPFPPYAMRQIVRMLGTYQEPDVRKIGRMPDLRAIHEWIVADIDKDGVKNGDELAIGRNPNVSEGAIVGVITQVLED